MTLPRDIQRCTNLKCPMAYTCLRYTSWLSDKSIMDELSSREGGGWVSIGLFEPDDRGECAHYITDNFDQLKHP